MYVESPLYALPIVVYEWICISIFLRVKFCKGNYVIDFYLSIHIPAIINALGSQKPNYIAFCYMYLIFGTSWWLHQVVTAFIHWSWPRLTHHKLNCSVGFFSQRIYICCWKACHTCHFIEPIYILKMKDFKLKHKIKQPRRKARMTC